MSPEVAASTEELRRNLLAAFSGLYCESREQKVKALSTQAGLSSTYLHKVFNGTRKLTLDVLLQVVAASKDPLERLFRRYVGNRKGNEGLSETLATILGSPAELLEDWREKPEKKDPFLVEVEGWVVEIGRRGSDPRPAAAPLKQVVLSLEEERLRDWRWLKQQLEERALDHWRELTRKERLPRTAIAELGVVVAAWAAALRVAGFRGNAIDALRCAFELADLAEDSWAKAFCLQKAAYLAHDFGHDKEALIFVQRATLLLAEDPTVEDLARNTVDRGYFCYYLGHISDASRYFRAGLSTLAHSSHLYRQAAHLGLAAIANDAGDMFEAQRQASEAAKFVQDSSLELAHLRWRQARISVAQRNLEEAVHLFKEAIAVFGARGNAGDVALVVFDLAQVLAVRGQKNELRALALETVRWLGPLTSNAQIREELEDFMALLRLGSLAVSDVERARHAFREAGFVTKSL